MRSDIHDLYTVDPNSTDYMYEVCDIVIDFIASNSALLPVVIYYDIIGKQTAKYWEKLNMYYIERGLPPVHMIAPISIL